MYHFLHFLWSCLLKFDALSRVEAKKDPGQSKRDVRTNGCQAMLRRTLPSRVSVRLAFGICRDCLDMLILFTFVHFLSMSLLG